MQWIARGDLIKNPYSALISHMRTQGAKYNTPYVQVGAVVASDPLTIKIGDLQIGKDNILIANGLAGGLIKDDLVALTPMADGIEGQIYIVLVKVVSP